MAKFRRFVRAIRQCLPAEVLAAVSVETVAVGLLERVWHCTMASAPCGDIGRLTNEEIAEAAGWYLAPSDLIEALLAGGWLDRSADHRLLVHDWHEHAPRFVHGVAAKKGGFLTRPAAPLQSPTTVANYSRGLQSGTTEGIKKHNITEHNNLESMQAANPTRGSAVGIAAELFRRLRVSKSSSALWRVAVAVARGAVPRTLVWDVVDSAARNASNAVPYFTSAYLAEIAERGIDRATGFPELPPSFGPVGPPEAGRFGLSIGGVPGYGETLGGAGQCEQEGSATQRNGSRKEPDRLCGG